MEKITITRALNELKLLDKKIMDVTGNSTFVTHRKSNNLHIVATNENEVLFDQRVKSNLQSYTDLLARYIKLKNAINESNVKTLVTINGLESTVSEAISRKTSIMYDKELLSTLRVQLNREKISIESENNRVQMKYEAFISEGKQTTNNDKSMISDYVKNNQMKLVDPLKLQDFIIELANKIDEFESTVDFVLSESNSVTFIEI